MSEPATTPSAHTLPTPGRWILDPQRTTVVTRTRAMFGLLSVTGRFRLNSGEISIGPDPSACTVTAIIDAASFDSGNARRDADVSSPALLDSADHPDIIFTSHAVRADDDGWVATGDLSAHGTTRSIEILLVTARAESTIARFSATTSLDRRQFGVTGKKAMVANTVRIDIDAVATSLDR